MLLRTHRVKIVTHAKTEFTLSSICQFSTNELSKTSRERTARIR
jgi:hypothetical protein